MLLVHLLLHRDLQYVQGLDLFVCTVKFTDYRACQPIDSGIYCADNFPINVFDDTLEVVI